MPGPAPALAIPAATTIDTGGTALSLSFASDDRFWMLDAGRGHQVIPGTPYHAFAHWPVSLWAQTRGAAAQQYTWDLSSAPDATNVTGHGTARLEVLWATFTGPARENRIRLTVKFADGNRQQEYVFRVNGTDSPAWQGLVPTTPATWPAVIAPDRLATSAESFQGPGYAVRRQSGELLLRHELPSYNPGVPSLNLVYSSAAAEPTPVFLVNHVLAAPVPASLTVTTTVNGVAGPPVTVTNVTQFHDKDIIRLAAAADAASLPTGRYPYAIAVQPAGGNPVNYTGSVTIVNEAAGSFGAPLGRGWQLDGWDRIVTGTGGVALIQPDGTSLWFNDIGNGMYAYPFGDYSLLTKLSPDGWRRTFRDGTRDEFLADGRICKSIDRNGNTLTYGYTGALLTSITDPNCLSTTLAYTAGQLISNTDPAARVTGFAFEGDHLAKIIDADGSQWDYRTDAGALVRVTDPPGNETTFGYSSPGRLAEINQPDGAGIRVES